MQFQRINPSTQVALFARCTGNCSNLTQITWRIYRDFMNSSSDNLNHWISFNQTDLLENRLFFGKSLSRLWNSIHWLSRSKERRRAISQRSTICSRWMTMFPGGGSKLFILFLEWRVRVRWISKSILHSRGIKSTLFSLSCPDWFDQDEIHDYSLYTLFNDSFGSSQRTLIGFS